jgi:VWFA-related protein
MKKIIILILITLSSVNIYSQVINVYNLDKSQYPTMSAEFYAFDKNLKQQVNLLKSDFEVLENGISQKITNISCENAVEPTSLSVVLTYDVSGSMANRMNYVEESAKVWIENMRLGKSECAITAFSCGNYLIQDYSTDKNLLLQKINDIPITGGGGGNLDIAFLRQMAGSILISKTGQHKKIIIFMTDGLQEDIIKTDEIITEAIKENITIYTIALKINANQNLIDIANKTGGQVYSNVKSVSDIKNIYAGILNELQGGKPCKITWESEYDCDTYKKVELSCIPIGATTQSNYSVNYNQISKLDILPEGIRFGGVRPGTSKDTIITVTAKKNSYVCTDIISSNNMFSISPKNFTLKEGSSINLKITYTAIDSNYSYSTFSFISSPCNKSFYAMGGLS